MFFIVFAFLAYASFVYLSRKYNNPHKLIFIFGKKGSGKSTYMVQLMLRHLKRGMSEQVLERKRITTAVHQIFPSKRVAEHVNTCFQNAALMVIVRNCQFQGVL